MSQKPSATNQIGWLAVSLAVTSMAIFWIPASGSEAAGFAVTPLLHNASLGLIGLLLIWATILLGAVLLAYGSPVRIVDTLTLWHLTVASLLTLYHIAVRLANWNEGALLGPVADLLGLLVLVIVFASRFRLLSRAICMEIAMGIAAAFIGGLRRLL